MDYLVQSHKACHSVWSHTGFMTGWIDSKTCNLTLLCEYWDAFLQWHLPMIS